MIKNLHSRKEKENEHQQNWIFSLCIIKYHIPIYTPLFSFLLPHHNGTHSEPTPPLSPSCPSLPRSYAHIGVPTLSPISLTPLLLIFYHPLPSSILASTPHPPSQLPQSIHYPLSSINSCKPSCKPERCPSIEICFFSSFWGNTLNLHVL